MVSDDKAGDCGCVGRIDHLLIVPAESASSTCTTTMSSPPRASFASFASVSPAAWTIVLFVSPDSPDSCNLGKS